MYNNIEECRKEFKKCDRMNKKEWEAILKKF